MKVGFVNINLGNDVVCLSGNDNKVTEGQCLRTGGNVLLLL